MSELLKQFKKRRKALGLKQVDMMLAIGMSRQQYHHLETKGNPRLDTLELVAKGLKGELMFIPSEKRTVIKDIIENKSTHTAPVKPATDDDPWKDIWEDDSDNGS